MTNIDGATAAQRALLEKLLAGAPETRLQTIRVEPWDPVDWDEMASLGIARGDPQHAQPLGVALVVTCPEHLDTRGEWEAELLGLAFAERAAAAALPEVQWVAHGDGGSAIYSPGPKLPLANEDLSALEAAIRGAAGSAEAEVESLEIFRFAGHAVATTLRIDEPHSFLRWRLRELLRELDPWLRRLAGDYVEVRDGEAEPVAVRACYANGCMSGARGDLACCDPFYRHMIESPPRPLCPIVGAA